jgi:hypothetical protein
MPVEWVRHFLPTWWPLSWQYVSLEQLVAPCHGLWGAGWNRHRFAELRTCLGALSQPLLPAASSLGHWVEVLWRFPFAWDFYFQG